MSKLSVILGIGIVILLSAVGYFLYVKFIKSRELTEEDFDEVSLLDDDDLLDLDDDFVIELTNEDIEIKDDDEVAEKMAKEIMTEAKNEVTKPKPSRYARRYHLDKN